MQFLIFVAICLCGIALTLIADALLGIREELRRLRDEQGRLIQEVFAAPNTEPLQPYPLQDEGKNPEGIYAYFKARFRKLLGKT